MVRKVLKILARAMSCIFMMIGICMIITMRWEKVNIGQPNFEKIIFSITTRIEGANMYPFYNLIIFNIIAVVVTLVVTIILFRLRKKIVYRAYGIVSLCLVVICCIYANATMDIYSYVKGHFIKTNIYEENYVDPQSVEIVFPEKKRNLVYIYIESMEITYADEKAGGVMERNFIPNLTALATEGENFSCDGELNGAYEVTGTGWTAASEVAQTSGVSLKDYKRSDAFLPGVVTLGEILRDNGYILEYICGSSALFADKRQYFTEHGEYDIRDYHYMIDNKLIPEDYKVNWGVEDEKVFDYVKDEILRLEEGDAPFCLQITTADTHFPDGYKCRLCGDTSDIQYENVIMCSDKQIYEFVIWLQEQSCYEDTTIVLTGDHLTMDQNYISQKNIPEDYTRRVYTTIINSSCEYTLRYDREFAVFDLYPTTLAAMGARIEGNRLGLGVNLYSDIPTLVEKMGLAKLNSELEKKSVYYDEKLKQ